jgi:hypothetical protein
MLLFSLLLLALPLSGFGQSTLNFPRLLEVSDASATGLAIVNPSASAASVTFTYYSDSGAVVATSLQTVPARNSYVKFAVPEVFASVSSRGWIQATSTTTGLQGFWLGGDFDSRMDGAETAPVAQEFIFPLATADTELSLVNLATSTNGLTMRLYGSDGTELTATPATQNVPPNGAFKANLNTIFTTANFNLARYVKVTGTAAFTGTTVVFDFIHSPSWSVVNGINTELTVSEANFGHVPSGSGWTSMIGITNFSATAQTVTITYNRPPGGGTAVSVTRTLPARGSLRESAGDLFTGVANGFTSAFENGWVKVTGTAALGGFIAYGYQPTGGVAVVTMQPEPSTAMIFSHVANGPVFDTGLALLNATTEDAVVEVFVMRMAGGLVGGAADSASAAFTIPAGTKYVGLLEQFVAASVFDDGFVYMRSVNNVPLYGFQLFYRTDGVFKAASNVAAGALHPSITFTPPAPPVPLPTPVITSLTSPVLRAGVLTISGTGFSATAASNAVFFTSTSGTVSVTPTAATTTSLTVTVPLTALNGPLYVSSGGRFSPPRILEVFSTSSTLMNNIFTVSAGLNTIADIYVTAPVGTTPLNITGTSLTETSANTTSSMGTAPLEITRGQTKRLWIAGDGITNANGSVASVTGSGITVTTVQIDDSGLIVATIVVDASATVGPRSIIVLNTNKDQALFSGGLIVR